MKFSKSSWHYRLIGLFDLNHPNNLCAYFWKTVLAMIFSIVVPSVLVWVLGMPLWYWLGADVPRTMAVFMGLIDVVIIVCCVVAWIQYIGWPEKLRQLMPEKKCKPPKEKKPPGLFRQWLSAKHRKVCPLIEFEKSGD